MTDGLTCSACSNDAEDTPYVERSFRVPDPASRITLTTMTVDALYCTQEVDAERGRMQVRCSTRDVAAEAGNAFALTASVEDVQIEQCTGRRV